MCTKCGWKAESEDIDGMLESLDDLPDRAIEFREGVEEKLESMNQWIIKNKHITDKMAEAIANIAGAIDKWLERDDNR